MPPNILFVFSDQQRWDTLGCYGQRLPVTPNLDALAAEGTRFENVFTCQPVCGPARACIQTGKWATQTGCFKNDIALPTTERTMAHFLADAGYEVGYCGKWHLASQGEQQNYREKAVPPHLRGGYKDFWIASDVLEFTSHSYDGHMFDGDGQRRCFPAGRYRADFVTDCALEFINRPHAQPFFLFVSYIEPHHQNDHRRFEGPQGSKERFAAYDVPGDLVGTRGDWRENYPDYLGCCWSLDQQVGRYREALVERDLWDNTVVIYTSDHGCHFCTRNGEYKRACHDGCLRIPMIIRGPGFPSGRVPTGLVSLLDTTPTVLTAAGVPVPNHMGGRALQPLADGTARTWRDLVYAEISEDHIGRTIRTVEWKYAIRAPGEGKWSGCARPGSDVYDEEYLYDLTADPHERHNLVADPALGGVRADLCRRLVACMDAAGERAPEIRPATGDVA